MEQCQRDLNGTVRRNSYTTGLYLFGAHRFGDDHFACFSLSIAGIVDVTSVAVVPVIAFVPVIAVIAIIPIVPVVAVVAWCYLYAYRPLFRIRCSLQVGVERFDEKQLDVGDSGSFRFQR
ncbi:hypothetical protein DQG23_09990 [Paenibacillus contaminans]|uniref:Uncharacterized protein n=1 Tax=Paenibacillus contaminans TaxID=450362 RepID=A0A329MNQ4_9BACL|nr:hypothetical protein DQG23_09990 [Paenibacillus contaminans]